VDPQRIVFDRHFPVLFKYFSYRDLGKADCEDACQEVFLRFFQKYTIEHLDEVACAKILYVIAHNVYREWVRSAVKHSSLALLDTDLPEGSSWETYVEEVESPEGQLYQEELRAAIAQLSPNLRQVIELRFFEGLTRREIAEKLNTKEKYVHIYQQRGIKALQKLVSPSA
jgi:RNA polymerase sigma-70 factor (ECF subfamily)